MGITGLNKLIMNCAPKAFFSINSNCLYGKRVAIDACNWMYNNMNIARKKVIDKRFCISMYIDDMYVRREWFTLLIRFLFRWLENNITPVFVFDGVSPLEKKDVKDKRKQTKAGTKKRIEALQTKIEESGGSHSCSIHLLNELKRELKNYNVISAEDFNLFKTFLHGLGIPCIQASSECEHLCSVLCMEGKVAAVYSADTDNLVYGCPLMITKLMDIYDEKVNRKTLFLECVRLDEALRGLHISHTEFVDMCILCGCDYNTGFVNDAFQAYILIQQYKLIDLFPATLDISKTKHYRCRELFAYKNSQSLILPSERLPNKGIYDIDKTNLDKIKAQMEMIGDFFYMDRMKRAYTKMTYSRDGWPSNLLLIPTPVYIPPHMKGPILPKYGENKFVVNLMVNPPT